MDQYIQRYGRRLFGLCLKLCGSRPDAEDLYQTTWLKALTREEKLEAAADVERWLARVCVNAFRDRLRWERIRPQTAFATNEEKDRALCSVAAPEREPFYEVRQAVDELPQRLRLAVILYYYQGMDVKGAAQVLGLPEGTVKSRLSRARVQLKERLKDELPF